MPLVVCLCRLNVHIEAVTTILMIHSQIPFTISSLWIQINLPCLCKWYLFFVLSTSDYHNLFTFQLFTIFYSSILYIFHRLLLSLSDLSFEKYIIFVYNLTHYSSLLASVITVIHLLLFFIEVLPGIYLFLSCFIFSIWNIIKLMVAYVLSNFECLVSRS